MDRKARGPVPHHQVDGQLYREAKTVADAEGWSMSQVAGWGLSWFLQDLSPAEVRALTHRGRTQEGAPGRRRQQLPADVARQVKELRDVKDARYAEYLAVTFEAGWSLRAIADAAGVSRQAVHDRILRRPEGFTVEGLVAVPDAPFVPAAPLRDGSDRRSGGLVDWSIWVDRDVHLAVAQRARDERIPMYSVMEQILREYVRARPGS